MVRWLSVIRLGPRRLRQLLKSLRLQMLLSVRNKFSNLLRFDHVVLVFFENFSWWKTTPKLRLAKTLGITWPIADRKCVACTAAPFPCPQKSNELLSLHTFPLWVPSLSSRLFFLIVSSPVSYLWCDQRTD